MTKNKPQPSTKHPQHPTCLPKGSPPIAVRPCCRTPFRGTTPIPLLHHCIIPHNCPMHRPTARPALREAVGVPGPLLRLGNRGTWPRLTEHWTRDAPPFTRRWTLPLTNLLWTETVNRWTLWLLWTETVSRLFLLNCALRSPKPGTFPLLESLLAYSCACLCAWCCWLLCSALGCWRAPAPVYPKTFAPGPRWSSSGYSITSLSKGPFGNGSKNCLMAPEEPNFTSKSSTLLNFIFFKIFNFVKFYFFQNLQLYYFFFFFQNLQLYYGVIILRQRILYFVLCKGIDVIS